MAFECLDGWTWENISQLPSKERLSLEFIVIFPCTLSVMVYICLIQGMALLGGVDLLELVCHCGHGLKTLTLAA